MLPLEQVITTDRLRLRTSRPPNFQAEIMALHTLSRAMVESPQTVLQQLSDTVMNLCAADSAGISLLEHSPTAEPQTHFRWVAASGQMAPFVGNTMPRGHSPCGSVLDADSIMLMNDPVRHYEYISGIPLQMREVLLVPFYRHEEPIGTLWIISHEEDKHFDMEDARMVASLSQFASVAVQVLCTADSAFHLQQEAREAAERRLVEVAEQNARLDESERNKMEFLATLSHELKNALSPLSNALYITRSSSSPELVGKAHEILVRQSSQINSLVDDLLDVAGISTAKLRLQLATINLSETVAEATEIHRELIERTGQRVTLHLPDRPLFVRGDQVRLFQVLANLFSNAAKYGASEGVVEVSLTAEGGHAVICLKDRGTGIDNAMLPKIFDLFVQGEHAKKGLGIGLALVHRLVAMHGGDVSVHSDGIGRGSEFRVRLPLVDAE